VVVWRKGVQAEFVAYGAVGGIDCGEFQVGGVLNGQSMLVKVVGIGVLHPGRLLGVALAGFLDVGAGRESGAHGRERCGLGIRPTPELHRGQVHRGLHGGQNGVGAAQLGIEAAGVVDAHLKFRVQFHCLAGKGELGGRARLVHVMHEQVEIGLLRGGELAGFALGIFLADDVGGDFGDQGGGVGQISVGQPCGDLGIFLRGGDDEGGVVGEDCDGEMRAVAHNEYLVEGCRLKVKPLTPSLSHPMGEGVRQDR